MKTLTINLPETFQVPGMVDAPEHLRAIPTTQWNEEFCLAAIKHGVKQSLQDTWSSGKKDVAKLEKRYNAFAGAIGTSVNAPGKVRPNSPQSLMKQSRTLMLKR